MKRFLVVILAVLMLGLAMPKPSEANGAWVPAAVIGGIILGAAITQPWYPAPVYAAPEPVYVYPAPAPVRVYRAPMYYHAPVYRHYSRYGHRYGYREGRHGYRDGGHSFHNYGGWDRGHR